MEVGERLEVALLAPNALAVKDFVPEDIFWVVGVRVAWLIG
jgi:hypothetical protein